MRSNFNKNNKLGLIVSSAFLLVSSAVIINSSVELFGNDVADSTSNSLATMQLLAATVAVIGFLLIFNYRQIQRHNRDKQSNLERVQTAERATDELKMALNAHAIVAMTDSRGVITEVNDKFCTISQYSREELIGQTHRIINSGHHPREFFQDLWRTITRGEVWSGDVCNRAKDGSLYWVQSTVVPLIGKNGKPEQYIAIRADITSRKAAEAKAQRMALHDALTGLPNRRLMTEKLAEAVFSKAQQPGFGAVLLMDGS